MSKPKPATQRTLLADSPHTALMIGNARSGSPWSILEIEMFKIIERAMCAEFGLTHGEYIKSAYFTAPAGFQSPAFSLTVGIPMGSWLADRYPLLLPSQSPIQEQPNNRE
jgi:hypothetical protein